MLLGIKLRALPTSTQKQTLSQWMGCARFIWNAKCDDERYMACYARKYCPIGTYAPIDQKFSQYKSKELSPWLYACPSQILRNSAVNWYQTYWKFIKGECGKPRHKHKSQGGSIHLTRELFKFEKCSDGNMRLFIGSKTNNIGYLNIIKHKKFKLPNSIHITQRAGKYWVSFCYGNAEQSNLAFNRDNLAFLKQNSAKWLEQYTVGIDRGVVIPVQANDEQFDFTKGQKRNKDKHQRYVKRMQRQLSKKMKGSVKYKRAKQRISRRHEQIANIRQDFCHKASHAIVTNPKNKVIVLEDLNTKGMTRKPKPKSNTKGGWDKNQASAKAGLNQSILDKGWHKFENYLSYKSQHAGKAFFKVSAQGTSQACAACDHTHPDNRKTQAEFLCVNCGHSDNADRNAAMVISKRAIKLILHSGTELSNRGVLTLSLDKGRGAEGKTFRANPRNAVGNESSKKKRTAATSKVAA